MHLIWKIYKLLCLCLMVFSVLACQKEDPNPELLDPIYNELKKIVKSHEDELKSAEGSLKAAEKDLKAALPNSVDANLAMKNIAKSKLEIKKANQELAYYKIRLERRYVEVRRNYKIAHQKGEKWINHEEYEAFKVNQRLREASLNWNRRVPKLFKSNPNYTPPQKMAPKEESEEKAPTGGH